MQLLAKLVAGVGQPAQTAAVAAGPAPLLSPTPQQPQLQLQHQQQQQQQQQQQYTIEALRTRSGSDAVAGVRRQPLDERVGAAAVALEAANERNFGLNAKERADLLQANKVSFPHTVADGDVHVAAGV